MPAKTERGAALILVLLVTVVLFVIVSQVQHSAKMDMMIARNEQLWTQATEMARGSIERAKQQLADDLLQSSAGDALGGGAGGTGGTGGNPFGDGGQGGDNGDTGDTGGAAEPLVDHSQEDWAQEGSLDQQLEDMEILVRIEPENAKLNILGMLAEGDYGELCQEQFVRLLRSFRANTSQELSPGQAESIAQEVLEYMSARRSKSDGGIPATALKSMVEQPEAPPEEEGDGENGDAGGQQQQPPQQPQEQPDPYGDVLHLPLTIDELVVLDSIDESLLYDIQERGEIVPGLVNFITVYTSLNLDPDVGSRVNLNFARRPVLEAIAPEDLSEMAEEIEEFRTNPPPTEWLEEEEQRQQERDDQAQEDGTVEEEEEEQEIEFPYFRDLQDMKYIDSFENASEQVLDEAGKSAFLATVTTQTNVFSIHVKIMDRRRGMRRWARAVVLRVGGGESGTVQLLPIVPFEWRTDPKLLLFPEEEPWDEFDSFDNFDNFFQ